MKFLHTSDWHLGQKFITREREEEHRMALDWLVETIAGQKVDALLVAGDIFDIGNPPNYARAMYYNFLKQLRRTGCRHVVLTGGNHDSPNMLDAPKELLEILDVHVVGAATDDPADELVVLKNDNGEPEAIVAAVPFLRDQDLRKAVPGEAGQERIERIREGIKMHYEKMGELAAAYRRKKIPLLAMGHLYATGAQASDAQDNIYLGNLENIQANQFPALFDYVALGHIHRAQAVGGMEHVRYSGSLIPLSFSETKDDKVVVQLEFNGGKLSKIEELPVPLFRRLKSIGGTLTQVQERLEKLHHKYAEQLQPWVEAVVETDTVIPNLSGLLQDFIREMNLDLLRTRLLKSHFSLDAQTDYEELDDLSPLDVFRKKCESAGRAPADLKSLEATFRELEEWHREEQGN
ncbi:MAG: exonuclease SbcCD subunit D C-terminal domain-containing protein [Saprospiraceae bacterium]